MQIKNPAYFGKLLHDKGFRVWFLYMFRIVQGSKFIEEAMHADLFKFFQDIYDFKILRGILNLPPRSAKTTLCKYFLAYCLAKNPSCHFIYTSFSQSLLSGISSELAAILQHPTFLAMYNNNSVTEDLLLDPLDDFWKEYLDKSQGKDKFTASKITTKEKGVILFSSIGSTITGFGAGIRGAKIFSGCMFIDDANKPADIRSQTMRTKVKTYYQETLLTRLNDSSIPLINVQQRLHIEDLSGILEKNYKFEILKKPLLVDGICQLPSQYTPERVLELQQNEYTFCAQYQQEPTLEGGNLFKMDAVRELSRENMPLEFDWRFITGDLAYKDKQSNDFTCFSYWGVKLETIGTRQRPHLYLIDVMRKKINAVDIEKWIEGWIKQKMGYGFRYIWIEDKSHGIFLNQLYRQKGYPIPSEEMIKETLPRETDKVMRANNIIPCLDLIAPNLTFCTEIADYPELLQEFLAFPNVKHDDFTDTVIDGIKIGLFTNDVVSQWDQLLGSNG